MSYRCIIWAAAIPLRFQWGSTERGGEREGESELEGCAVFGIHGTARDCCSQASNNLSPSSLLLSPTLLRYEMSPLSLSPSLSPHLFIFLLYLFLSLSSSSSSPSSLLAPHSLSLSLSFSLSLCSSVLWEPFRKIICCCWVFYSTGGSEAGFLAGLLLAAPL